jgi:hypothetical protein
VTRRLRVRFGDNVHTFGGATIPDDRIVELTEHEVAAVLRERASRNSIEVLGWVESDAEEDRPPD